eukprot:COSAG02_NODE_49078_length_329_cov_0.869565_1_plen_37_part_01
MSRHIDELWIGNLRARVVALGLPLRERATDILRCTNA